MRRVLALLLALSPVAGGAEDQATPLGDAERGGEVFRACISCHQIGPGAENGVGPHLNGIFDRPAGAVEDFAYSPSMQRAAADGLTWDFARLDAFLENPRSVVSGTRMSFRGIKDNDDRRDVIAYLRTASASPQNSAGATPTAKTPTPEVDLAPGVLGIEGDIAYGEYLSSECKGCHQVDGSNDGIPSITGWPEEDFVVAMHAYKQKLRPHPVMQMMAGRLSDEEIAALAAYFANLK